MKIDIYNTAKKYSIIYADPPWAYLWGTGKDPGHFSPERHYQTMSLEEICALGPAVRRIREKNCALFVWATMPCLPDVFDVIESWGFKYKTCAFTWIKTRKDGEPLSGMGSYTKSNAELCLLAMRGHIKSVDKSVPQVLMHPRIGHSVKPDEIMRRIERLFGPDTTKIELFARRQVEGWDSWGNEL
ncbi:MAG: DNA methyltransferase [Thermoguttaceae bacterium]|nr:DNA methyltransferase [Thermoguttaceae bacterium]